MNRWLSRVVLLAAAIGAAVIIAAISVLFLGGSLYLFLVSLALLPATAALIVGAVGLTVGALILLVVRLMWRRRPSGVAQPPVAGDVNDLAAQLGGLLARQIASGAQAHPYGAVGVALVAGLAVGVSPALRKLLLGALKN